MRQGELDQTRRISASGCLFLRSPLLSNCTTQNELRRQYSPRHRISGGSKPARRSPFRHLTSKPACHPTTHRPRLSKQPNRIVQRVRGSKKKCRKPRRQPPFFFFVRTVERTTPPRWCACSVRTEKARGEASDDVGSLSGREL